VVKYIYDAWGNHAVVDKDGKNIEDPEHIGNKNPFRYRGYYYDVETGLYYLQTRYYDPEVGRFISQDGLKYADSKTINGLNLYAYCLNNPNRFVDRSGCIPIVNSFNSFSSTYNLFGFNSKWWGRFVFTATETESDVDEVGIFYAYTDYNKSLTTTWGAGINLWNWWGGEINVNNGINLSACVNITPYFHNFLSIGLDGITIGFGLVINDISYDLTLGIGLGPLIIIGGIAAIIGSMGQAASTVWDWFKSLFGL